MPAEEFVARVLGKMLEAGREGCVNSGGLALHYNELPQALWTSCRNVLGIGGDARSLEALQAAARRDAENPHFEFATDSQRKQREASPALRQLVERWAGPAYRALEAVRAARLAQAGHP